MRTLLLLLAVFLVACGLREGRRGEPLSSPRTHLQLRVDGVLVVESGNPEVASPRYTYQAFESFDMSAVALPVTVVAGAYGDDNFPYDGEKQRALANAKADAARFGTCASLVDATVAKVDWTERARFVTVSTPAGVELDEEQLADLCSGGVLP